MANPSGSSTCRSGRSPPARAASRPAGVSCCTRSRWPNPSTAIVPLQSTRRSGRRLEPAIGSEDEPGVPLAEVDDVRPPPGDERDQAEAEAHLLDAERLPAPTPAPGLAPRSPSRVKVGIERSPGAGGSAALDQGQARARARRAERRSTHGQSSRTPAVRGRVPSTPGARSWPLMGSPAWRPTLSAVACYPAMSAVHDPAPALAGERFGGDPTPLRDRTARGTLINGTFLVGTNALNLIKGLAVASFLTASQYGTWGLLMAAFMTIVTLGSVGVDDKYVQQNERRPGARLRGRIDLSGAPRCRLLHRRAGGDAAVRTPLRPHPDDLARAWSSRWRFPRSCCRCRSGRTTGAWTSRGSARCRRSTRWCRSWP